MYKEKNKTFFALLVKQETKLLLTIQKMQKRQEMLPTSFWGQEPRETGIQSLAKWASFFLPSFSSPHSLSQSSQLQEMTRSGEGAGGGGRKEDGASVSIWRSVFYVMTCQTLQRFQMCYKTTFCNVVSFHTALINFVQCCAFFCLRIFVVVWFCYVCLCIYFDRENPHSE